MIRIICIILSICICLLLCIAAVIGIIRNVKGNELYNNMETAYHLLTNEFADEDLSNGIAFHTLTMLQGISYLFDKYYYINAHDKSELNIDFIQKDIEYINKYSSHNISLGLASLKIAYIQSRVNPEHIDTEQIKLSKKCIKEILQKEDWSQKQLTDMLVSLPELDEHIKNMLKNK